MKTLARAFAFAVSGIILVAVALSVGTRAITPDAIARILFEGARGIDYAVLVHIRMPRVICAMLVGASLALSGTAFQAVLKNPLADPYLIGVSGGAALGATGAIIAGASTYAVAAASFAGSLAAVAAVYFLSRRMMFGSTSLILSGVALGFILSSGVLMAYALVRSDQVHRALMWLMGDLGIARYDALGAAGAASLIIAVGMWYYRQHLDVISLGEKFSRSLGVTPRDLGMIFWMASLLAAIAVSLAGVIGFVGLIVPHVARNIFGPRHSRLLPSAAAAGALFLLASDTVGRVLAPPYEVPAGVITSFLGGVFFLILMARRGG